MTLSEIIVSALEQLDRGSDPQLVTKFQGRFNQYANEAVQDLAKDFPLHTTESVSLLSGKFYTTDLSKWAVKILSITQDGKQVDWDEGEETGEIIVMATGSVNVKYKYLPEPMTNVSDRPDVPEQLHQCIVTYVVAREKGSGDPTTQGGASLYFQLYNEQKSKLTHKHLGAPSIYRFTNR